MGGVIVDTFVPETPVVPPAALPPTATGGDGGEILIFSPESNQFVISYTLNGTPFELKPGEAQTIINDQVWTIEFLGSSTGIPTRYTLLTGRYKFKLQDGVVGLFATRDLPGAELPPAAPSTPPPAAIPSAPAAPLTPPTAVAPQPGASTGTITIFIQPENRFQIVYALNNEPFSMSPGEVQEFDNDREWVIQFLGSSTGTISTFSLESGFYEFVLGNEGVELQKADGLPQPTTAAETAIVPAPAP